MPEEQRSPDPRLQLPDLLGDRPSRDTEFLSGLEEALVAGGRLKALSDFSDGSCGRGAFRDIDEGQVHQ
jgi:hypothetical protein